MKKFFCKFYCLLEAMGQARAAACLSRHGHHEAAKRMILNTESCKC
jgi:hypothetical protein